MWSGSFMFLSYQSSISKYSIFFPNRILYEIDRYLKVYAINHSIPYCLQNFISVMAPSVGHFADTAEFFFIYSDSGKVIFWKVQESFSLLYSQRRPSPKKDICCKKKLLTFVCVFGLCCCRFVPNMGIKVWVKC